MLTKRKNSPFWYASIYIGNYKKKRISLKTTDRQEAKYLHAELEQKYFKARKKAHIEKILDIKRDESPAQSKGILLTEKSVRRLHLKPLVMIV